MIFIRVDMIYNQSIEKRTLGKSKPVCSIFQVNPFYQNSKHSIFFSLDGLLLECFTVLSYQNESFS